MELRLAKQHTGNQSLLSFIVPNEEWQLFFSISFQTDGAAFASGASGFEMTRNGAIARKRKHLCGDIREKPSLRAGEGYSCRAALTI